MHPALLLILKATLLLGAALLAVQLLSKANPRWRMFVCQIAAVSVFILPIAILLPIDIPLVVNSATQQAPSDKTSIESAEGFPIPEAPAPVGIAIGKKDALTQGAPTAGGSLANVLLPSPLQTLVALYIIGLIVLLSRFLLASKRIGGSVASLPEAPVEVVNRLEALASNAGLRTAPKLRIAPGSGSPFCIGSHQPAIVVPESLTDPAETDALEFVLRHELHHIANRDLRSATLLNAATALLWFHPLVWLLRRRHTQAMEELGDRVAAGDDRSRERYRSMLARLALGMDKKAPKPAMALGLLRTPEIVVRLRRLGLDLPHQELRRAPKLALLATVALPVIVTLAGIEFVGAHIEGDEKAKERQSLLQSLADDDRERAEQSIKRALVRLVEDQAEDGGIHGRSRGKGPSNLTGTTALAGMAMFAHGGADAESPYHKPMQRCIDYILASQNDDTGLFGVERGGGTGSLYNHTTATTFLATALPNLRGDRGATVRKSLEGALQLLIKAQAIPKPPERQGGWRYTSDSSDSDLSCSVWAVRALYAIEAAGINVPDKVLDDAIAYVERSQAEDGGFKYTVNGGHSTPCLTAGGLYCLQKAGKGDTEAAAKAEKALFAGLEKPQKHYEFYALMWAASAIGERGGPEAKAQFARIFTHCNDRQHDEGGWPSSFGTNAGAAFVAIAYGSPF